MPKNIILFLTDDHGQWAWGPSGNRHVQTPNLDYLAQGGVVMDNAFTPTPVCSPARANLLTGRTSSQHGIHDYLDGQPQHFRRDWLKDEVTLPELLQRAGYRTGLVGKWHLGNDDIPQRGFDYWNALAGDYPIDATGPARYSINGRMEAISGSKAEVITDAAVAFLRTVQPNQPFFLFIGHVSTHSAWEGHPERLVCRYRGHSFAEVPQTETYPFGEQDLESRDLIDRSNATEALAQYYAAVSSIDEGVGRVLDTLDAIGARDDTLIVYTSDHGLNCGHHGIWGKGNGTLPLNMTEETIRVPLMLNGSGLLRGQRRTEFVDHLDLFQTLVDLAGLPVPHERNYPGRSYLQMLIGKELANWRDVQFCEYGDVQMLRTSRYKYIRRTNGEPDQLFDLQKDPREMRDCVADPDVAGLVSQLRGQLEAHYLEYRNPERAGTRPNGPEPTNSSAPWVRTFS